MDPGARRAGRARAAAVTAALVWAALGVAQAGDKPRLLTLRGEVVPPLGQPESGTWVMRFKLRGVEAESSPEWTDSVFVKVESGRFKAVLGKNRPIPEEFFESGYRASAEADAWPGSKVRLLGEVSPPEEETASMEPAAAPPPLAAGVPPLAAGVPPLAAAAPADTEPPPSPVPAEPIAAPPAVSSAAAVAAAEASPAAPQRRAAEPRVGAAEPRVGAAEPRPRARSPRPGSGPPRPGSGPPRLGAAAPAAGAGYVVEEGDTLKSIAAKLWGEPARWRHLYDANAASVARGGKLVAGQRLVVPDPSGGR